jgi:hypothetical protein
MTGNCIMETKNAKGTSQIPFSAEPIRRFNEIVCQAIDETLEELVGPKVVKAVYVHLRDKFGVDRNELPYRIDTLLSVLEGVFGVKGARVIERKMAKRLYDRILLPFNEEQGLTLEDFLKLAKETIRRDNYYV